jgi:hypothetical protein
MAGWKPTLAGRVALGSMIIAAAAGVGVSTAQAAPVHAKSSLSGTFDCGGGVTGTFVVNSGNAQSAQTWNSAHMTFASGGTGIFVPTELDLTITVDGQTVTSHATKGSAPSTVSCSIAAAADGFSLTGTVTGKIVRNG